MWSSHWGHRCGTAYILGIFVNNIVKTWKKAERKEHSNFREQRKLNLGRHGQTISKVFFLNWLF